MKHLLIPPFVCQSLHRRREVLSTRRTRRAVPVVHLFPRKFPETSTQTKANMNSDERPKLDIVPQLGKLPDDLVAKILSFLDAASLVRQRSLNRSFRRLASDTTLWQGLCYNLWKDKIHVEREARDLVTTDAMAAYRRALEDAQTRDHMTREELCYDPTTHKGTIWSLRFKEAAGECCAINGYPPNVIVPNNFEYSALTLFLFLSYVRSGLDVLGSMVEPPVVSKNCLFGGWSSQNVSSKQQQRLRTVASRLG
jgi:F-box-like